MPRWMKLVAMSAIACVLLAGVGGCTGYRPTFVADGGAYDEQSALALLDELAEERLTSTAADEGPRLRQEALGSLRKRGGSAERAASTITKTFPADSAGVPYYVEVAEFEGAEALMILEAKGRAGGNLDARWLWVVDSDGRVLFSGVR